MGFNVVDRDERFAERHRQPFAEVRTDDQTTDQSRSGTGRHSPEIMQGEA